MLHKAAGRAWRSGRHNGDEKRRKLESVLYDRGRFFSSHPL